MSESSIHHRLNTLAERRRRLVAQSALQRAMLSGHADALQGTFALADKGVEAARYLRAHPGLLAGAAAFTLALRPRKAFTWLKRGWLAWRLARKLRQHFATM